MNYNEFLDFIASGYCVVEFCRDNQIEGKTPMPYVTGSPQQIIQKQIADLRLADVSISRQVEQLEKTRFENRIRIDALISALNAIGDFQHESNTQDHLTEKTLGTRVERAVASHPTFAIRRLLMANPDGLRLADIINSLREKIQTTSENPSHILRTCLNQLRLRGKVGLTDDGKYVINNESKFEVGEGP